LRHTVSEQDSKGWIPEIQGMRAISIIGVMLFHAGLGVPGGFVGVDVFFVISGFLITRIVLADLRGGRFSFALFYERRIRRIVPALSVLLLAVLGIGWLVFRPEDYSELAATAAAQCLGLGNFVLWRNTGYFAAAAEEQPLLHMWSLAVEEQFYFLLPTFLWLGFDVNRGGFRFPLKLTLGAMLLGSLLLNLWFVSSRPSAVFFLVPTRAWEMLAGCLLAETGNWGRGLSSRVCTVFLWLGTGAVMASMFLLQKGDPFPGWRAMIPVTGASLMIVGLHGDRICLLRRCLGSRLARLLGELSYSLYLWHWPLLAGATLLLPWKLPIPGRIVLLTLSVAAAAASLSFVENPIRRRSILRSQSSVFAAGLIASVGIALVSSAIYGGNGLPGRFADGPAKTLALIDTEQPRRSRQANAAVIRADEAERIGSPDPDAKIWGVMWGDSHAMSIVPALDQWLREHELGAYVATHTATAPVLGWYNIDPVHGLNEASEEFGHEVVELVRRRQLKNVLLVACWSYYDCPEMQAALLQTVSELRSADAQVWILTQVPFHPHSVPRVLWYGAVTGQSVQQYAAGITAWNGIAGDGPDFIRQLELLGAKVLDIRPPFMNAEGQHYIMEIDGRGCYADSNHLNDYGALKVVLPFLRSHLNASQDNGLKK
jgi:peptidoglycan/LPS O-acetylase OafA/YrhL